MQVGEFVKYPRRQGSQPGAVKIQRLQVGESVKYPQRQGIQLGAIIPGKIQIFQVDKIGKYSRRQSGQMVDAKIQPFQVGEPVKYPQRQGSQTVEAKIQRLQAGELVEVGDLVELGDAGEFPQDGAGYYYCSAVEDGAGTVHDSWWRSSLRYCGLLAKKTIVGYYDQQRQGRISSDAGGLDRSGRLLFAAGGGKKEVLDEGNDRSLDF